MANKFLVPINLTKNELQNAVIHVLASNPSSPALGQVYFNSTDNTPYVWNGTAWKDMATVGIAADSVSNTELSNMAQNTIKGRVTAGTGDPEDLTATQVRTIINVADGAEVNVVDSVNTQTGAVVLDADDISDAATTKKFTTAGNLTKLGHISVTQAVDLDTMESNIATNNSKVSNVTTNLGYTAAPTNGTVTSSDGTDATLTLATGTNAGLLAPADFTILSNTSGTNSGDNAVNSLYSGLVSNATHTGEVTGSTVLTIADNAVTNAKAADMAQDTIKGRATASTGDPEDLSAAQVRTIINVENGADVTDTANVDAAGATMNTDTDVSGNSWVIDEDNMASNTALKVPTQQSVKSYVDAAISGGTYYQGGYNASTNSPNLDSTPTGVSVGDMWTVTTAGTFYAEELQVGDALIAEEANPATVDGWTILNKNIQDISSATETAEGLVELATQTEVNTGTDTTRVVTADTLQGKLDNDGYTRKSSFDITADDTTTAFILTHNLATRDVKVEVYDATTYDTVYVDVSRNTINQVTVTYAVAPTTGTDYRAVVVG